MPIFEALQNNHDRLLALALAFSFNKRNSIDLYRIALYGSMLEFAGALCALMRHKFFTGVPSLFRSFLETSVELENLLNDPDYIDNMEASHTGQWLKLLEEARTGKNPYLALQSRLPDIDNQIELLKNKLRELKLRLRGPLSVFNRFDRANMLNEYRSLYNSLSCDTHSNIRALISRHTMIGEGERNFDVCYYRDEPLDSFLPILDGTLGLLLNASFRLHSEYQTGKLEEIQQMLDQLQKLRSEYAL